ncbi:unnamed protein product [Closterium sp. NIES-65]|nr:unnamed protein product [Closterium sp. NIES-65]
MLAEQQSTCQELERTSSRANESSAADKEPSHCNEPSQDAGNRTGVAASHKRPREDAVEASSSKANREKMRRDRLNDRFVELARSLEGSGQARADRGSILADAVRVLAQLRAETAQLRGSAEQMKEQIRELKAEKSELREEKARLQANKQQLEEQVRRMAASGAAQSTAATSAAAPSAAGSGAAGAVPLMLHPACEPGKVAALGAPMAYSAPTHLAAAPAATCGTAGTAGSAGTGGTVAAASGPQYMAPLPSMMPYGMPGMAPMAMWQWLPQSAVDSSNDQMLRPPVA